MRHRRPRLAVAIVVALLLLAAIAPTSSAQVLDHPTLYRLERVSTFQRGCFAPCMCPIMEQETVIGTFRLELISVGNVFDFYEVRNIRWRVRRNSGDLLITGSGTYKVSTIADEQEMSLDLAVGTDPPTHYESGVVPGGANFPRIALPISIHGGFCFDTVIELKARPARRVYVDRNTVHWDQETDPVNAGHDVVQGDLGTLLASGGAFELATRACLADGLVSNSLAVSAAPAVGQAFWFLERGPDEDYEDGDAAQVGSPDDGIAASSSACP